MSSPNGDDIGSWIPENVALLGKVRDTTLAKQLGISRQAVAKKRDKLNIPPFGSEGFWTPKRLDALGKESDEELAFRWKVKASFIRNKRRELGIAPDFCPELRDNLGKVDDDVLAQSMNLPISFVKKERIALGIPSYRDSEKERRLRAVRKLTTNIDAIPCIYCGSRTISRGKNERGVEIRGCTNKECKRTFTAEPNAGALKPGSNGRTKKTTQK
jgi:hypothetical protein